MRRRTLTEEASEILSDLNNMGPDPEKLHDQLYHLADLCASLAAEVEKLKEATVQTQE
jgi:hypothetical protein